VTVQHSYRTPAAVPQLQQPQHEVPREAGCVAADDGKATQPLQLLKAVPGCCYGCEGQRAVLKTSSTSTPARCVCMNEFERLRDGGQAVGCAFWTRSCSRACLGLYNSNLNTVCFACMHTYMRVGYLLSSAHL
jgi:hypothetical protein